MNGNVTIWVKFAMRLDAHKNDKCQHNQDDSQATKFSWGIHAPKMDLIQQYLHEDLYHRVANRVWLDAR